MDDKNKKRLYESLKPGDVFEDGLNLRCCDFVTSLPVNLTVTGNLNLAGCKNLKSLPENLTINGDLNLFGCINIFGCINLKSLPANLKVTGDLHLTGCKYIKSLPVDLKVEGMIYGFNQFKNINFQEEYDLNNRYRNQTTKLEDLLKLIEDL
jgi:hypothetical protein